VERLSTLRDHHTIRKSTNHKDRYTKYKASASDCGTCSLRARCTLAPRHGVARHLYEEALNRMQERVNPEAMRLRRSTVEHPFATMKYRIFGHPRLLMRGLSGAKVEIGLATMAYNLKRITNVLGTVIADDAGGTRPATGASGLTHFRAAAASSICPKRPRQHRHS